MGCEHYRDEVAKYSWNVNVAMAVMQAESGCNPSAVSPKNYDGLRDYGLFQIHGLPLMNPEQNVKFAFTQKFSKGGWGHWTVCNKGIVSCF